MTDHVDRMFQLLVTTIRARSPEALARPFEVGDLYQNILPYRLFRRDLGLETNQDYEMTLLELLSGARGYLIVEDRMADALRRECESADPDPSIIRQFSAATISIDPAAVSAVGPRMDAESQPRDAAGTEADGAMPAVAPLGAPAMTSSGRPSFVAEPGMGCRFCGGVLPAGRRLTFCPHCGQDQTVLHCDACGSDIEAGWKFCIACGRGTQSSNQG